MSSTPFRERFLLAESLGVGGTARVFRAQHRKLDRPVAIKFLMDGQAVARRRFVFAYVTLRRVRHSCLPVAYEYGVTDEELPDLGVRLATPFVVDELLVAPDFDPAPMPPARAALLGAQVAAALAALHAAGVVHHDVKPENMLRRPGPGNARLCLADLGLAAPPGRSVAAGTVRYMAPELLEGQAAFGSDIFALAMTISDWLKGNAGTPFDSLLRAMTARRPEDRPSAREVFEGLCGHAPDETLPDETLIGALRDELTAPGVFVPPKVTAWLDEAFRRGTAFARVHGPAGAGQSDALEEAYLTAILNGWSTAPPVLVPNGSLGVVAERLGTELPAVDMAEAPWRAYVHLGEVLLAKAARERLVLLWDAVPADSPLDRLTTYLQRLAPSARLLWLQATHGDSQPAPNDLAVAALSRQDISTLLRRAHPLWEVSEVAVAELERASTGLLDRLRPLLASRTARQLESAAREGTLKASDAGVGHSEEEEGALPDTPGEVYAAAESARRDGRFADALRWFRWLLARGPNPESLEGCVSVLLALGRADEAGDVARHAHRNDLEARVLLHRGDYAGAARALEACARGPAEDAALARALMLAGRHEDAEALCRTVLDQRNDPSVTATRGLVAFYQGRPADAVRLLRAATVGLLAAGETKELEQARGNLALVLQKHGQTDEAETLYKMSLEAAQRSKDLPTQILRLSNLATLHQDRGDLAGADGLFRQAWDLAFLIDSPRQLVRIALNRANVLSWVGDGEGARAAFAHGLEGASQLGMQVERTYLLIIGAQIEVARGGWNEARSLLEQASAALSDDAAMHTELHCVEAGLRLRQGDAPGAVASAQAAIAQARRTSRPRLLLQAQCWHALATYQGDLSLAAELPEPIDELARGAEGCTDPHLAWWALALAALHGERSDAKSAAALRWRTRDAFLALAATARRYPGYARVWFRREPWFFSLALTGETTQHGSWAQLAQLTRKLLSERDPGRLLEELMDAAIALSGAERGFVVLSQEQELTVHAARNLQQEDLDSDIAFISQSVARAAISTQTPINSVDALEDDRFRSQLSVMNLKLRSILCLPLRGRDRCLGALYLDNRYAANAFSEADVAVLLALGDHVALALDSAELVRALAARNKELLASQATLDELNQRLNLELRSAGRDATPRSPRYGIVGDSPKMLEVLRVIERVAPRDVPVLVLGESGVGKELVARALHDGSKRARAPFVSINCGAISPGLLESELFGHERGAFTGAVRSKPGLFEVAAGGTLFLDEIAEMPPPMQVKLLRVLQEREFRRVGGTKTLEAHARILAATNRDLEAQVRDGAFREDLYYRLNVVELWVPPLRDRRADIPKLARALVRKHGSSAELSPQLLGLLMDHDWPGNVRELENELQRIIALSPDGRLSTETLSAKFVSNASLDLSDGLKDVVDSYERKVLTEALSQQGGNVTHTARVLKLTRAGLYKKLHRHGLTGKE